MPSLRACLPLGHLLALGLYGAGTVGGRGDGRGLGTCLVLEEGSGLGQSGRASEAEMGTPRLAVEGGLYSWSLSRWGEWNTNHPRRREALAIGTSGSQTPSGHSSSPSLPLQGKPPLHGESRWWMPPHLPLQHAPPHTASS